MGVGQCPRPGLGAMFPAQTSHKAKFSDPHPLLAGLSIPVSSEVSAHVLFPKTWLFFFFGLGNPMDRGAWWTTVHKFTKSLT